MKIQSAPIAALISTILAGTSLAQTPVEEKFSGNSLDPAVWYKYSTGKGNLKPENKKLNFVVASKPTNDDFASIELLTSQPGYNESWELTLDLANTSGLGMNAGCGIMLFNAGDRRDYMYLEFYGKNGGVTAGIINNGKHINKGQASINPRVAKGSIRIRFDKDKKLMTLSVSPTNQEEGYTWIKIGTFSPSGSGGKINADWKMNSETGRFGVQLFGFAQNNKLGSGKATFDNLSITAKP